MLIVRQASVEVSAPQGILLESRCYVFRGPPPPGAIVPEPGESVAPAVMSLRDAEKALRLTAFRMQRGLKVVRKLTIMRNDVFNQASGPRVGRHRSGSRCAGDYRSGEPRRERNALGLEHREQPQYGPLAVQPLHGHDVLERVELLGRRRGNSLTGWEFATERPHRLMERFDVVDRVCRLTSGDRRVLALECHLRRRDGLLGGGWPRAHR